MRQARKARAHMQSVWLHAGIISGHMYNLFGTEWSCCLSVSWIIAVSLVYFIWFICKIKLVSATWNDLFRNCISASWFRYYKFCQACFVGTLESLYYEAKEMFWPLLKQLCRLIVCSDSGIIFLLVCHWQVLGNLGLILGPLVHWILGKCFN